MKEIHIIIYGIICFAFAKAYSQQQPDTTATQQLEEIILSATRTPRQLSSLPLPVTLISKKQIKQTGSVRVNEILGEQTGLIMIPDESGFEGIQIQGIDADYVMIMIDGVPLVGRSAGNFDLSRLTVGNIKQIEVVKGPSSALYGSEALAGVINIITEKPTSSKIKGNASLRIGSFTQVDANFNINQQIEKLGYGFSFNRFSSDGYDLTPQTAGQTVSPFTNYTVGAKLLYDFSDDFSLTASSRFYTQNQDNNLEFDDKFYTGESKETEWNIHLKADHRVNDALQLEYELYGTNYKANESTASTVDGDILFASDFNQYLLRPEVRMINNLEKYGTITSGLGYQYDELDRSFFDKRVDFNSQYVYSQWDISATNRFNVIVGARFDNHSAYSNQLSPKIAMRYEINDRVALKGSVGYGFKAPDFRQLYFDFTNSAVGYTVLGYNVAIDKLRELQDAGQIIDVVVPLSQFDDPLKAESSIGTNIGATYKKGKWKSEINLFRNDFSNLIDTQIIARKLNGQNVFSYRNFDKVFTTGAELDLSYQWNNNLRLSGGYQLLYAYDKTQLDRVKDGQVFYRNNAGSSVALDRSEYFGLVNRSRHTANLKIFYHIPSISTSLNLRTIYRSKYGQFDTNGNAVLDIYDDSFIDGFMTTNIAVTKRFNDGYELQLGANNLFDYTDNRIPNINGTQLYMTFNYNF